MSTQSSVVVANAVPARSTRASIQQAGGLGFRHLALATAIFTYALIVMGAGVRVSGSGLGCPDWPTCYGSFIPPPDLSAWIEWTHRTIAAVTSPLILATMVGAWIWRRHDRGLLTLATLVPFILAIQIGLGAVVVMLELHSMVVMVHMGFAQVILGMLIWIATVDGPRPQVVRAFTRLPGGHYGLLVGATAAWILGLVAAGAYVQGAGAAWACAGFPACNGRGILPFGQSTLMDIQLFHRAMAYAAAGLVVWVLVETWRLPRVVPALRNAAVLLGLAILAQAAIGAMMVSTGVPPLLQGMHVAGATATWAAAVVIAGLTYRSRPMGFESAASSGGMQAAAAVPANAAPATTADVTVGKRVRAFIKLTKPGVMSLLLATTAGAMVIAARGMPAAGIFWWTLIGGALAAGGASAINHYLDRDIDPLMGRTALRPIPSGVVRPLHALWFGIGLGALSLVVFVAFVNVLAAVLSLSGLLGYVFVYTMWLKRTTPSNIVIGGAAGAVPPLVGWAAVTNEVSLTAVYLFAIVFFWTPPHFWALALLIRGHYERAHVPMLPVVRGDAETRWQILLYSALLVALTLVLYTFQLMGLVYLACAITLGTGFIILAVRLWKLATPRAARQLYGYSILYLALLFVSMAVDRVIA